MRIVAGDAPFVAWPGGRGFRLQSPVGGVSAIGAWFSFGKKVVARWGGCEPAKSTTASELVLDIAPCAGDIWHSAKSAVPGVCMDVAVEKMQTVQPTPDPSQGGEPRKAGREPVSQAKARNATLINLLVTPGFGSMMAGKFFAGLGQFLLAAAGAVLLIIWFVGVMIQYYGMLNDQEVSFQPRAWLGIMGAITFIISWLWALMTSIGLMREARRNESTRSN